MFPRFHAWHAALLAVTVSSSPRDAMAQTQAEPARGGDLHWELTAADSDYFVLRHERVTEGPQEEPSERLRLRAGPGTYIYAHQLVEPARILDDLQLHAWVESDRQGVQVYGQIVLPDTLDPATGRRATVLVAGEAYETVGRWQKLRLDGIPLKLERQVRVLRARLRQPVDVRRAYLAGVVVNVYGGPGTTDVQLGPVELTGNIAPADSVVGDAAPIPYDSPGAAASSAAPELRSGRLLVEGRPFFPRVIEHRGEPLALLHELGFNTIYLARSPTPDEQRQARQLSLWLIAPMTAADHLASRDEPRVLAWFAGEDYAPEKMPPGQLDQLRRRDPGRRPIIAGVERSRWEASRELDILLHCRQPLGTSFELSHFGPWLDQLNQLSRPGTPFWSCIQTEVAAETQRQVAALSGVDGPMPARVQAEQVRQLALAAVAAGARGLWFRSTSSLDGSDPETQWRRWVLEWVNAELTLIEPWAMGGRRVGEIACQSAEVRVVALATARSRLLIPTLMQGDAQFATRRPTAPNALVIAGVADSTDAFQLTHLGLSPLKKTRISGGLRIEVPAEAAHTPLLLTEDPLVVSHINRVVGQTKHRRVQLEQDLAQWRLVEVESSAARTLLGTERRIAAWETARQALQTSRELSRGNDWSAAYRFAAQAHRQLDRLEADLWREIAGLKRPVLNHPAAATLPLALLADVPLAAPVETFGGENLLRGGECENLSLMIEAGWRQRQLAPADIETYLALSPQLPHGGRFSLRMVAAARTPDADQSVVERPPIWVHTAPVAVQPGERISISGWLRIDQPIRGSYDGCQISDSIGGPPLALRFHRTDGWEPFQMIRMATEHDHLTVTIALHGLGEVWLDDLTVSVEPNEPAPQVSQRRWTGEP